MTYANRMHYIGGFDSNMRHGKGKLIWPDGREYYGHWIQDKRSGEGYFTSKNGVKRKEVWLDGKRLHQADEGEQVSKSK